MSQSKIPRFMSLVRSKIRVMQYSYQTEKTYVYWIKHFIHYHNLQHPKDLGTSEVTDFLTYLAVHKNLAPATQNQALCALVYLYKHVLELPLGENTINAVRAKYHRNLPVVLSVEEIRTLLTNIYGLPKLMTQIIYGTGLRKSEVHRLRVKDIDIESSPLITLPLSDFLSLSVHLR